VISQSELQERVLRALFQYVQGGSELLKSADVALLLKDDCTEARVNMALKALVNGQLVDVSYPGGIAKYIISNKGYLVVEETLTLDETTPSKTMIDPSVSWLPASDRMVPLNHNDPEYLEVANRLAEVREVVRTSNDLSASPDERDAVLLALDSASSLWKSTQLSLLQIRVGVLMAGQQAWTILKSHAKAIAAALLVDAVKSFLKTHCSIDLDAL
jgi:hypothetical protein